MAKRWYLAYILAQIAILGFTVFAIFAEINPNLSAVIALVSALLVEGIRFLSDIWKSSGESAKRRLEIAEGLGQDIDGTYIAECLVLKKHHFLEDVSDEEVQGSIFDSTQQGAKRLVENTQESAWWSMQLSRKMVWWLGWLIATIVVVAGSALVLSICSLQNGDVSQNAKNVQNVGGVVCTVLVFIFSVNLIRLLVEFFNFSGEAKRAFDRCTEILKRAAVAETEALHILHDYQIARNSAPLMPTFIWKIHRRHLQEQWEIIRPKPINPTNP